MAKEGGLGLVATAVTRQCPGKGEKVAGRGSGKAWKRPLACSSPSLCRQCVSETTVTVCELFPAELDFSLVAKGNLNKRNKAGYSVSNCYLHNFFLIAFSIDDLCQDEHFTNDAGRQFVKH